MKTFNQKSFNEFIIKQGIVGFYNQPILFKSGRLCHNYINWRNVAKDVYLLDRLIDWVLAFVNDLRLIPRCFYGVPEAATKLGIITQYKWAKMQKDYGPNHYPFVMGRAIPKDHGDPKDRYFVGEPRGETIILEDTVTTGSSLLAQVDKLKEIGIPIITVIVLTDRNEKGENGKSIHENVKARGIPFYAMSDAKELLPEAVKQLKPNKDVVKKVEEYYETYGVEKITLCK